MKIKRFIPALSLLGMSACFAVCSVGVQTWDHGERGDTWETVESYHTYNITNNTQFNQFYDVCYEVMTQMFDHSHVYRKDECKRVIVKPGESTGDVPYHLQVKVNYPKVTNPYYVAIDADTVLRGACEAHQHMIKRLKVY